MAHITCYSELGLNLERRGGSDDVQGDWELFSGREIHEKTYQLYHRTRRGQSER